MTPIIRDLIPFLFNPLAMYIKYYDLYFNIVQLKFKKYFNHKVNIDFLLLAPFTDSFNPVMPLVIGII